MSEPIQVDEISKVRGLAKERDLRKIKFVLGTLINWMAQSSVSPISIAEAEKLLEMLQ